MRSLEQFYTVAFEREIMLQTIKIDRTSNGRIDAGLWVDAVVPECYRPRVREIIMEVFEGYKGLKLTEDELRRFVEALRSAIYNRLEPIHPSLGDSEHFASETPGPSVRDDELDVCTCGRSRGSLAHADGARNGHAFEPRHADQGRTGEPVNLAARWLQINALNAELAAAVTTKDTIAALRLMKRIADAAALPHSSALIYDWSEGC